MVSELFDPRRQVVWSDWVGKYIPRKIPNPFRSLAADQSVLGEGSRFQICGKIPKPGFDLGKMMKSVVRYEADASDPPAVWRIVHLRPIEEPRNVSFRIQPREREMGRRVDDLRQISPSSPQGVHLLGAPEGNSYFPSTGFSVVATGWEQDQLPDVSVRRIEWENLKDTDEVFGKNEAQLENGTVVSKSEEVTDGIDCAVQGDFGIPSWLFGLSLPDAVEHAKDALLVMDKNVDSNEVGEIQKDESALKGSDAKTKSNDPMEAPSQPVDTNDKAEAKKGVNESGDEDKINKDVAVKTNFVMANVPDEAKFYLAQLYMVGRGDKLWSNGLRWSTGWLWSTRLLWKPPPWPDVCAMACDRVAQRSGYEVLVNFHSVKKYHIILDKAFEFNDYCRSHQPPISLTKAEVCGLFGSVYCDFRPEFTVLDVDSEDPHTGIIASISNDNPALVSCVDDERLEFQDGDLVVFSEVQGMTELNDGKQTKIIKARPYSFCIQEGPSNFGNYAKGGIVTQVEEPMILEFKSLRDSINEAATDYKMDGLDEKLLRLFASGSRAILSPMDAMFGGIVGQEVMKACSGKLHRNYQFFYFDSVESLPVEPLESGDLKPENTRYAAQISVFGYKLRKKLEQEDFMGGAEIIVFPPVVYFSETVLEKSSCTVMSKFQNKHNRLYMEVWPRDEGLAEAIDEGRIGPRDDPKVRSKILTEEFGWDKDIAKKIWCSRPETTDPNMVVDMCKGVQYPYEIKDSVVAGFQWASKEDPLAEENMHGICFEVCDVIFQADASHRGGGQVTPTARRVISASQFTAKPRLLEPVNLMEIKTPENALGGIHGVLNQKRRHMFEKMQRLGTPLYNITALRKCVMQTWLPASNALFKMTIFHSPSPSKTQKHRVDNLYEGPLDDIYAIAIRNCDSEGPLILHVSKMVQHLTTADSLPWVVSSQG